MAEHSETENYKLMLITYVPISGECTLVVVCVSYKVIVNTHEQSCVITIIVVCEWL